MKHSHPPTLLTIARRTLIDEHLIAPEEGVLVAVSGGPDSMALLHVIAKLAPELGAHVVAHGVDHGLRAGAGAELAIAERFATRLGVPFASTRVDVRPGPNLMARARHARYEALQQAARGASALLPAGGWAARPTVFHIATGHHADDRAETVLIRLLRGTGPVGLAVLPPRAGNLIRPFVRARRADVMAHLARHRIPFAEDPTNRDPRFLRTRVRQELVPLMAEVSPRIVEHLCELADASHERDGSQAELVPPAIDGHPLGRAQRAALGRALAQRNARARVPLGDGKIAGIDLSSRRIVLIRGR